jgi:hypothetical protein
LKYSIQKFNMCNCDEAYDILMLGTLYIKF